MLLPVITGMKLTSASGYIDIGTKIYNSDGSEFGTVLKIESNHLFPNGGRKDGVLIDFGGDATPQWVDRRFITRTKYVVDPDPNNTTCGVTCGVVLIMTVFAIVLLLIRDGYFKKGNVS